MMINGFLNVNKPQGPTSHDIVARVRRLASIKQVGHAGTLDPMATGVLVVALGYATRLIEYLAGDHKRYSARIKLGVTTDTYDARGKVLEERPVPSELSLSSIALIASRFAGDLDQIPPNYSAIKAEGQRAYTRARNGEQFQLQPRHIHIYQLSVMDVELPYFTIDVECSAGTYIRSLAHDLGKVIGCGATLTDLVRTQSGQFKIEDSVSVIELEQVAADNRLATRAIKPSEALASLPHLIVGDSDMTLLQQGRAVELAHEISPQLLAYNPSGDLIAVLEPGARSGIWQPAKVFMQKQPAISQIASG